MAKLKAGPGGELSAQLTVLSSSAKGAGTFSVKGKVAGTLTATYTVD